MIWAKLIATQSANAEQKQTIERQLAEQDLPLGDLFDGVDVDKNGQITREEFAAGQEIIQFFDQIEDLAEGEEEKEMDENVQKEIVNKLTKEAGEL
jgi:hypothetical protein